MEFPHPPSPIRQSPEGSTGDKPFPEIQVNTIRRCLNADGSLEDNPHRGPVDLPLHRLSGGETKMKEWLWGGNGVRMGRVF